MSDCVLSDGAYCKMVLHALKYPHAAVNGLLVGERRRGGGGGVSVTDAVPLLHQCCSLVVSIEAALCHVDAFCQARSPPRLVVGFYCAASRLNTDQPLDAFSCRVAERVQTNFADALLLSIDNAKLRIDAYDPCFDAFAFEKESKSWKSTDKCVLENEERCLATTTTCIQTKLYRELVDFDNYLDNPSLDYWNEQLNHKIARLAS